MQELPGGRLTAADVAESRQTIANVPLWDSDVLQPALGELQSIGAYYGFPSSSVDRYVVGGFYRVLGGGHADSSLHRRRPNDTLGALALKGGTREEETDL